MISLAAIVIATFTHYALWHMRGGRGLFNEGRQVNATLALATAPRCLAEHPTLSTSYQPSRKTAKLCRLLLLTCQSVPAP